MRTSGRLWRVLALLMAFALVAAACGDDDDDANGDATTTTADAGDDGDDAATDDEDDAPEPVAPDAGSLTIGTVLPETGQLAFLGPPMVSGVEMAIRDINAAGGVLGSDVRLVPGDSGTDPDVANTTVDRLLAEGVNAIVGAAASGITRQIVDKVTGAGVVQCSPSNTAPDLFNAGNDGFYFRTAPSDAFQGVALAEVILEQGHANVAILTRNDEYGVGFAGFLAEAIEEGGGNVVFSEAYDPNATNFDAEVQAVIASSPDAVALIAFEEGIQIIQTMIENGAGPADVPLFIGDGTATADLGNLIDPANPGIAEGIRGTAPSAEPSISAPFFPAAFAEFAGEDADNLYAPQSYDCVILIALAALQAGTADPAEIRDNMASVSQDGTECFTFAECKELIEAGEDIDYIGASGPIALSGSDPTAIFYEVLLYGPGGELQIVGEIITN